MNLLGCDWKRELRQDDTGVFFVQCSSDLMIFDVHTGRCLSKDDDDVSTHISYNFKNLKNLSSRNTEENQHLHHIPWHCIQAIIGTKLQAAFLHHIKVSVIVVIYFTYCPKECECFGWSSLTVPLFWVQVWLGQKYYTSQVWLDKCSNPWPPDHILTTQPPGKCTVIIRRSWVWTPLGSNYG